MFDIAKETETFIAFKRGLGIGFNSEAYSLRQFVRFADSVGHTGPIDIDIALSWAKSGSGHSKAYEIERYERTRRLSDFCRAFDESLPKLPPGLLGKAESRVEPFIYTDEDIALLMYAAENFYSMYPLRPLGNKFLIGLLRATGMRPSEAVGLTDGDIDEGKHTILIKYSKGRTRLIPVEDSTLDAIAAYREERERLRQNYGCRSLIIANNGKALTNHNASDAFLEYRHVLLGRGEVWKRRPPRLMDIRHTFCTQTIIGWHEAGCDVTSLMPVLSSYMGHAHIGDTYWYLSNVPKLMSIACAAFRDLAAKEVFSHG